MLKRGRLIMAIVTLEGAYNVRTSGLPGVFRGAALDELTPAGTATFAGLDISVVIDLREVAERGPVRHRAAVVHNPIYRLPDGPPVTGTLEAVYQQMLQTRGPELTAAVAVIAETTGAVFVHCSAGKDRTGLVVALALLAVGTPRPEVIADYVLSAEQVAPHRHDHARTVLGSFELTGAQLADAMRLHLDSPEDALLFALAQIDELGGSVAYLRRHGLTSAQLHQLHTRLADARVRTDDE
ncbi:tyrosine-protein phosphatase [Cryobacterium sp. Hh11]|nr:tyrosine-protein phosphatase [Cryobacterium sp. Hh11]